MPSNMTNSNADVLELPKGGGYTQGGRGFWTKGRQHCFCPGGKWGGGGGESHEMKVVPFLCQE